MERDLRFVPLSVGERQRIRDRIAQDCVATKKKRTLSPREAIWIQSMDDIDLVWTLRWLGGHERDFRDEREVDEH